MLIQIAISGDRADPGMAPSLSERLAHSVGEVPYRAPSSFRHIGVNNRNSVGGMFMLPRHAMALLLALLVDMPRIVLAQDSGTHRTAYPSDVEPPSAPVVLDGDVLFTVRGVSAYPAAQRADAIAGRIRAMADDPNLRVDALQVVEADSVARLMIGDIMLIGITDLDAEGASRKILAHAIRERVAAAVLRYRAERSPQAMWRSVATASGATLVAALAIWLLWILNKRILRVAERVSTSLLSAERINSLSLLDTRHIVTSIRAVLQLVRVVLLLAIVFAWVQFVLGLFPWTRTASRHLFALLLDPLQAAAVAGFRALPGLVFVACLAFTVRVILKVLRSAFDAVENGNLTISGFEREWAQPTFRIARVLVIAFAVVVAYPYLPGSDSAAFKGVSLFLGVIFSLGSSSAIANVIAGYSLTYRRAFRLGDRVRIGDTIGDVMEMRMQVTHVRSVKNEEVVIPNSVILNSPVVNYSSLSHKRGLILHTTVGIGYETPWRQVKAMLLEAARRTEGLLEEPSPFVAVSQLGDFAIVYELNVYSGNPHAQVEQYTALHLNILDVFNEFGVQIMTPNYEADPETPKLVPPDQWFTAPAKPRPSNRRRTGSRVPV